MPWAVRLSPLPQHVGGCVYAHACDFGLCSWPIYPWALVFGSSLSVDASCIVRILVNNCSNKTGFGPMD